MNRRITKNRFKNMGKANNNVITFSNYQPVNATLPSLGFPDTLDVTLAYTNDLQLSSSVGEQQMIYEGNNPWDPDPQLGGQSADQYSVFASVYRYCRVYGSAIEVNYSVINSDGFQALVCPRAENASTSYEIMMCMPRCKTGRLVNANGMSSWRIQNDANTGALYGISNLDYDIANTFSVINPDGSTTSTEPIRKWYWHVAFQNNASQNSLNGAAKVRIFYRCHFYGRKFASNLSSVTSDGDEDIPVLVDVSDHEVTISDPI